MHRHMLPDIQESDAVVMDGLPRLIALSPTSEHMVSMAQRIAPADVDVLIEGEQGTGKRLLAKWIHRWSTRRNLPLIEIDCEALTETELEAQLFGSGYREAGTLRFPQAGTLLLTAVGFISMRLQARLLATLEENDRRSSRARSAGLRVITTSARSLRELVVDRSFRADLYYRLKVVPITVPALRVRREDIPVLAEQFVGLYSRDPIEMSGAFIDGLLRYSWPGNITELRNLIRRTIALSTGPQIGPEFLQLDPDPDPLPWAGVSWREAERQLLEATLAATQGNRTRAAEQLGVSVRTVRNKIRDFGLAPRGTA